MSKKNPSYAEHSKAVAALHQHISKGFSGLAASFEKASEHTRAGDCEKASDALSQAAELGKTLAEHHAALAECHGAMSEAAEKALADRTGLELRRDGAHGIVPDAPAAERNRVFSVPRAGAPPEQRKAAPSVFGTDLQPDTDGVDAELSDLVKANV
jgi:thioredoxin-like negative regulator of GroEL